MSSIALGDWDEAFARLNGPGQEWSLPVVQRKALFRTVEQMGKRLILRGLAWAR